MVLVRSLTTLDMTRVRAIYAEWRAFFAEGVAEEFEIPCVRTAVLHRWRSMPRAVVADFKEYFQYYAWGRCPGHLRANLAAHFQETVTFAAQLLGHIEREAPPEVMANLGEPLSGMITDSHQSMLRVLHYPPTRSQQDAPRAAAHEDINILTLLPAADGPGVEICTLDGR